MRMIVLKSIEMEMILFYRNIVYMDTEGEIFFLSAAWFVIGRRFLKNFK